MTNAARHPATTDLLGFFEAAHLRPGPVQEMSVLVGDVAREAAERLPDTPELTVGLRKLLEAKDCLVRAAVAASMTAEQRAEPRDSASKP